MLRQKDFTYDDVNFKGLPEFVRSVKKDGLRYIIILVSVTTKVQKVKSAYQASGPPGRRLFPVSVARGD